MKDCTHTEAFNDRRIRRCPECHGIRDQSDGSVYWLPAAAVKVIDDAERAVLSAADTKE